jgi:hypothetical protein
MTRVQTYVARYWMKTASNQLNLEYPGDGETISWESGNNSLTPAIEIVTASACGNPLAGDKTIKLFALTTKECSVLLSVIGWYNS